MAISENIKTFLHRERAPWLDARAKFCQEEAARLRLQADAIEAEQLLREAEYADIIQDVPEPMEIMEI